ncbi:MAG TPA: flavin reductase family protein [Baekduia sp.]|nr:flavin reductase family protein [Baekduia sp.]
MLAADPAATFREAMSHLASGVVLVTASVDGRPWGMTVSAACPVCTTPPTMLVSLSSHTALAQAVASTARFGVSVLGERALEIARFGSAVGAPKFLDEGVGLDCGDGHPAAAVVDGALAHVDCEVVETVVHGTHSLFLGRVRETTVTAGAGPLVHYHRSFWQVGEAA